MTNSKEKITYMDCWRFVAPLLPISTEEERERYLMVFYALKKADEESKKEE